VIGALNALKRGRRKLGEEEARLKVKEAKLKDSKLKHREQKDTILEAVKRWEMMYFKIIHLILPISSFLPLLLKTLTFI